MRYREYLHNGIDSPAVPLPHRSEPRLTTNVPYFDRDIALCDFPHVKAHCRDHVLVELAALEGERGELVISVRMNIWNPSGPTFLVSLNLSWQDLSFKWSLDPLIREMIFVILAKGHEGGENVIDSLIIE